MRHVDFPHQHGEQVKVHGGVRLNVVTSHVIGRQLLLLLVVQTRPFLVECAVVVDGAWQPRAEAEQYGLSILRHVPQVVRSPDGC